MPRQIREQNTDFESDTTQLQLPRGTTAQRPSSAPAGALRYNTTLGSMEQWTGANWDPIYAAPSISNVTSSTTGLNEDDNATITVTGSGFNSVDAVKFLNNSGGATLYSAGTVTINSDTQLTADYDASYFTAGQTIDIQVSSSVSGKSATATAEFTISADPVWSTSSGSLGTVADGSRSGYSVTVTATGGTVTYALQSGSFPSGASLNTSTGVISGNLAAVASSTTSTFTIRATSDGDTTRQTDRQFTITVSPPSVTFSPNGGSLGTLLNFNRNANQLTQVTASITSGTVDSFAVTAGSLPSGVSMASNGTFSGTAASVGSDTTYNFTVTATCTVTSAGDFTATKAYSCVVGAPVTAVFNASGTFTVPSGLTSVDVLVVAGGGNGGSAGGGIQYEKGGGGGAGGLIYRPGYPITPGSPISVSVGDGTGPRTHSPWGTGSRGSDSNFSGLNAQGGGGGGSTSGGSGGGSRGNGPGGFGGNQPGLPGDSGTYGFGNPGGNNSGHQSGGGGGSGGGGSTPNGGGSRSYSISGSSVAYAGGGGGYGGNGGGGGAGNYNGQNATSNRGSGGANGHETPSGGGGKGIVIVSY